MRPAPVPPPDEETKENAVVPQGRWDGTGHTWELLRFWWGQCTHSGCLQTPTCTSKLFLDGSLAGREQGWRSQPMGHRSWKPFKARAEVSPAHLSLPLPPSGSKALTHLHFCDLLDRETQEKEKKIYQNLEQFMHPVSIQLVAPWCCAPRLLQSSQ